MRRIPRALLFLAATASFAALVLVGCSSDDDSPAATAVPAATATPPGPLAVTTADNSFSPTALNARAGQKVTVNLKNDGQRPHTFTIDNVVDSGRLTAGESKAIEFTPTAAATLTYYCTVHGAAAMSGTLTVAASGAGGGSTPDVTAY